MTTFPELFNQGVQISQVSIADEITLTFSATSPAASCPDCGTVSTRIHSRYYRTIHDLPRSGRPVHLVLHVRRFRCQKSTCGRKIFAEQFPTLTRPHAQRSIRLQEALRQIGMALGGQAGTRLGAELGFSGSRDTILRLVRATALPQAVAPQKVGVDDWAWKRGHRYGTLICDLERGVPIDLLPDRSVDTLTAWFQHHPGIKLISRDRASEYAVAASKGAPQAVQVADRWHVLKNLREALEVLLAHHLTTHRKKKTQAMTAQQGPGIPEKQPTRSSQQAHIERLHREERLAKRPAAFLFLRRPADLTAEESELVHQLRRLDPEVDQAYLFVQQFREMIRTRTGEKLDAWLLEVGESTLVELHPFVNSISEDKAAVQAGFTREESNGPTEGHITRLKLIKRSMYDSVGECLASGQECSKT